jgi:hypothetical protein
MNKYQNYILTALDDRELLEQLAEEGAEMQQAALKLIRAAGMSNNPTPVSLQEAKANLQEEISDVLAVIKLLKAMGTIADADYEDDENPKWRRWAERLGYKDVERDEKSELAKAVDTIKANCLKRRSCEGCRFFGSDKVGCELIRNAPFAWKEIKDEA